MGLFVCTCSCGCDHGVFRENTMCRPAFAAPAKVYVVTEVEYHMHDGTEDSDSRKRVCYASKEVAELHVAQVLAGQEDTERFCDLYDWQWGCSASMEEMEVVL